MYEISDPDPFEYLVSNLRPGLQSLPIHDHHFVEAELKPKRDAVLKCFLHVDVFHNRVRRTSTKTAHQTQQ